MLNKLRERMGREEGFTLVELLVVMLILGILAAIAIPSFFNQRDKARDADGKAAARTAQTAIETYGTDNGGAYTGATPGGLVGIEETLTKWNAAVPEDDLKATVAADTYSVDIQSDTGNWFRISRAASGQTTLSCNTTGLPATAGARLDAPASAKDGCPASGLWG